MKSTGIVFQCLTLSSFLLFFSHQSLGANPAKNEKDIMQLKKVVSVLSAKQYQQLKEIADLKKNLQSMQLMLFSKKTLVFNSVANEVGPSASGNKNTRNFWKINYTDRLTEKGDPSLSENYYNPAAYSSPSNAIFVDEIEDLNGEIAVVMVAKAAGFDQSTMKFADPDRLFGHQKIYERQFASGWSSVDGTDNDTYSSGNCATTFGTTQHYSSCWNYNLGSDADRPFADNDWGPHVNSITLGEFNLSFQSGHKYSRVKRITRYRIESPFLKL